jgi:hypothetical protein
MLWGCFRVCVYKYIDTNMCVCVLFQELGFFFYLVLDSFSCFRSDFTGSDC